MKLIKTFIEISDEEISRCKKELQDIYQNKLKAFNVHFPSEESLKMKWLIYLYAFKGQAIHKSVITDFCKKFDANCAADQQVRHLQADGWFLLKNGEEMDGEKCPRGYYCLFNVNQPYPGFIKKKKFRVNNLQTDDFEEIKKQYGYCCATCGAKEGSEHRYGFAGKVQLQKGHKNPNKPLEIGNIIPQCQFCNRDMYKDNFIFDDYGRPIAINNARYIHRSTEEVQKQMYELLKKKFGES